MNVRVMNQPVARMGATRRARWADAGQEPFRLFFPAAVLAGLIGVALWPLYFAGLIAFYPGEAHARMMACGFFGGFIFGFLGTAMPRMLSARALGLRNVLLLFALYGAMVVALAAGKGAWGDGFFAALLLVFLGLMIARARRRHDLPPPGFVLVAMAFLCVVAAAALAVWQHLSSGMDVYWVILQRLLAYQGFVLLPILGIGPFILPRFFGMQSAHDFPETLRPPPDWMRKAALAFAAGGLIILSFFIEAAGRHTPAYGLRFAVTAAYLLIEFPFRTAPGAGNALGLSLRVALAVLAAGFLTVMLFPAYRTGLLHLTLMGGFAIITFTVATRVVFGHGGDLPALRRRNRWMLTAVCLMLLGMATRISGDVWPGIMITHYNYGALIWAAGVLLWAWKVLPKVLRAEAD